MVKDLYTARITKFYGGLQFFSPGWDWTSAWNGASGSRDQVTFDLTQDRAQHEQCVRSLTSHSAD